MHLWDFKRAGIHIWDFWMKQSIWVCTCVATVKKSNKCFDKIFSNPLEQIDRCWQWLCCKNLQAVADWKGSFAGGIVGKWCIWPWKSRRLIFPQGWSAHWRWKAKESDCNVSLTLLPLSLPSLSLYVTVDTFPLYGVLMVLFWLLWAY